MDNKNDSLVMAAAASAYTQERDYWLNKLSGDIYKTSFPYDFKPSPDRKPSTLSVQYAFNRDLSAKLLELSEAFDPKLHMILMASLLVLLKKYLRQNDILIGYPVYRQAVAGKLSNTLLVLRGTIHDDMTFKQILLQVHQSTMEALENQSYPIERLVNQLTIHGTDSGFPLLDTVLLLENIHDIQYIEHLQLNLVFSFRCKGEEIETTLFYNASLYKKESGEQILSHFARLLDGVLSHLDLPIRVVEILEEKEKRQLLVDFNDTQKYPQELKLIPQLWEEQVQKTPLQPAVEFHGQSLTYSELNQQANQMARVLRDKGVRRDSIVGLMTESSLQMIVGMIGILKAGGAYLSLDPSFPLQRILSMLDDSKVSLLLTTEKSAGAFKFTRLQNLQPETTNLVTTPPRIPLKAADPLPIPDRTLVDYREYHQHIGNAPARHTISLLSSRGCPYHCVFCHKIWPRQHVCRSAENIFTEIRYSYDAGIRRFVFLDDIFNYDLDNSSRLLEMIIKKGMNLQLFFPNGLRSDRLNKDFIQLLAEAGAVNIDVALESASPRIQKLMKKHLNLEKFQENIDYLIKKYPHIILELELMIGFPTETPEEAMATYELLKNLQWVHFPNLNILKIYPNTDVSRLAIEQGVPEELIRRSASMAYHEIPDTLPFAKEFVLQYQARFFSEYFLSKERLLQVLPAQMKILTEEELVKKYDSYLPIKINRFKEILDFAGLTPTELGDVEFLPADFMAAPHYTEEIKKYFPPKKEDPEAFRLLLLDCTQLFRAEAGDMLYDVVEAPLGLMYLLTYLNQVFGSQLTGRIAKSRIDFDSFPELNVLLEEFRPQLIGIRALTFYKDFFHRLVSRIKAWYPHMPIIAGGPYASSDYATLVADKNVDIVVIGEGEVTFARLVEKIMAHHGQLPDTDVLREIDGLAFITQRHQARRDLSHDHAVIKGADQAREILFLDGSLTKPPHPVKQIPQNPPPINQPQDLVYVLYTSGSTGTPKGVSMTHRAMSNLVEWQLREKSHSKGAVTLQFASFCFDVSFQEIFSTLCSGGQLIMIPEEMKRDMAAWLPLFQEKRIARMFVPFIVLQQFARTAAGSEHLLSSLREIITAGEQLQITPEIASLLKQLGQCTLHNHYGPTETHVVTVYTLSPAVNQWATFPPIGKPITNTQILILDPARQLVPIGVSGELHIGGIPLARGYLNNPELTAERFCLWQPGGALFEKTAPPGPPRKKILLGDRVYMSHMSYKSYIYRTGDLARWSAGGNIEFLGRMDHQVKIRGFRIELGEIENQLMKNEHIKEAVVINKTDAKGDQYLCAYMVSGQTLSTLELKEFLSARLPAYMIPSFFIHLEKIPLTTSGKVNRLALPAPGASTGDNYAPPRDDIEEKLTLIWQQELGLPRIGIFDNFFDSGGHSMKAIQVINAIKEQLEVNVGITDLFESLTIANLALRVRQREKQNTQKIQKQPEQDYYELHVRQKSLYELYQYDTSDPGFNLSSTFTLKEAVNLDHIRRTVEQLVERHEPLRTCVFEMDSRPVQQILPASKIHLEIGWEDISGLSTEERSRKRNQLITTCKKTPFNLEQAPLFRFMVIKCGPQEFDLTFAIHHIIFDGRSLEIMQWEFSQLYEGNKKGTPLQLEPLPIQYKDFTRWHHDLLNNDQQIKTTREFWKDQLKGDISKVKLPYDYPPKGKLMKKCNIYRCAIPGETTRKLRGLAQQHNATTYMVLFAGFNVMIPCISGQLDFIVGSPGMTRQREDLKNLIGFFANALIFRIRVNPQETFLDFLKRVKDQTIMILEHQHYPLEYICGGVNSTWPELLSVWFNLSEFDTIKAGTLKQFQPYHDDSGHSHNIDIACYFTVYTNGIEISTYYDKEAFKPSTIENMMRIYGEILHEISLQPQQKIELLINRRCNRGG